MEEKKSESRIGMETSTRRKVHSNHKNRTGKLSDRNQKCSCQNHLWFSIETSTLSRRVARTVWKN